MSPLLQLPAILKAAGLTVHSDGPCVGWETRGLGTHGPFASVPRGVLIHDTAGRPPPGNIPSLHTLIDGRTDLSGPLCNFGMARDGSVWMISANKGYHAGFGSWPPYVPLGNLGNSQMIGIEVENTGVLNTEDWPQHLMDSLRICVRTILDHFDLPAAACAGHKEYARVNNPKLGYPLGRKIDPDFDMTSFRAKLGTIKAN
jgi:hypothetical protein